MFPRELRRLRQDGELERVRLAPLHQSDYRRAQLTRRRGTIVEAEENPTRLRIIYPLQVGTNVRVEVRAYGVQLPLRIVGSTESDFDLDAFLLAEPRSREFLAAEGPSFLVAFAPIFRPIYGGRELTLPSEASRPGLFRLAFIRWLNKGLEYRLRSFLAMRCQSLTGYPPSVSSVLHISRILAMVLKLTPTRA